jgi:uncharacterized membrane protein
MTKARFEDKGMQTIIGWVLRAGVIVSMIFVFTGGVLYLWRHGHSIPHYQKFTGVPDFVHTVPAIINGMIALRGRAIIQTGILLLIATPIVRVMFSAVGFILEKDYLYTTITCIVLLIIAISAFSGYAG